MIIKIIKYFLAATYKIKGDNHKKANISFLRNFGSLVGAMLFNSISSIRRNIQIWWVLNTAGFSRRDVPWLIFFVVLVLVSPWFCLFIITRLVFILIILRTCVFLVDSFVHTVKTFDISERKPVRIVYTMLIAFFCVIAFKTQQQPILCQGEKQLFMLANSMIEALSACTLKVETKALPFAPHRYIEHLINSQIFDAMRANFGFIPKRHEQSTFLQLFLSAVYSSQNGEQGVYTHVNSHNLLGNSQPGNDYMGKFTIGNKHVLVLAEAKSTGFDKLLEKQLDGLRPEVQLHYYSQLVNLLLQANLTESIIGGKASYNKCTQDLISQPFIQDYIASVLKAQAFGDSALEIPKKGLYAFAENQALALLKELQDATINQGAQKIMEIKVNAVISTWHHNGDSVIKQLTDAKIEGLNRIDLVLFKKVK
jgi:hypothetical protein